jgi:branched-chain amino acid transport system substrate-binding protein
MMNKDSLINVHTRGMNIYERRRFDLEDIPVTSIDCLFLPVYTEEIKFVAPQFAFANLKAQLLGSEYWNDAEELRKVQQYVEGIVFCSDYFFDEADPEYIKFQNAFRLAMKRVPGVMEYFGLDALGVVLDAIEHKNLTREDIKNYLNNMENFIGLRGPITFKNNNRINSKIKLLTYKNGKIEIAE